MKEGSVRQKLNITLKIFYEKLICRRPAAPERPKRGRKDHKHLQDQEEQDLTSYRVDDDDDYAM